EKTRKEYLKNMEILSASAMELINIQSKNDIYKYVVSVIQSLTNAMLVVIAEITPDGNTYIPRNIKGNDKLLQQLYAGLNGSVIDKELPFGEPAVSEMRKGELIDVPGGLYGFTFEMAPPEICRNIEALYNIGRIRSMGITRKGKLFGNIAFVQETGADSGNSVFIETFIKQVSITLYHLNVEEELIISKEKAEASDRLKSAFLAYMSHEIRTPLNAIAGFSQVLNRKYIDEFKRGEYLSYIQKNCETLQVLINDILSISQIESEKLKLDTKECNLNRFLHELHTTFSEEIRKDHSKTIRLILSPMSRNADFVIMTDPNRLRQILMNLLSNAIKFTSTGSVEFGYEVISEYTLLFFVKDTGIGIPKDKHDVIFERFHRLESGSSGKFSGTGLGLSISKSLVGLLGGELWLDSEPDNGSRFYFTINYRQAEYSGPMVEEADQDPEFFRWAGKTILIAEDEDFNYLVLEEILGETGATIIRARNGKEAIDIFESGRHIDITLMDLQMPMLDGYQASRIILEKFPGIPIIAQTAYAMDSEKDKCMEAGISDYITKPIDMGLLMKKINFFIME
ncbi:MAG: ATP-binding protein, partial [Bacteroidota bacterium]